MVGVVIVPPSRKLEDLIRLAELCVDLLRQNEEFYAEVRIILVLSRYVQTETQCCNYLLEYTIFAIGKTTFEKDDFLSTHFYFFRVYVLSFPSYIFK